MAKAKIQYTVLSLAIGPTKESVINSIINEVKESLQVLFFYEEILNTK